MTPFTEYRPQPTYSVGFSLTAFSPAYLAKIQRICGTPFNRKNTYYRATNDMYFPFLTTETKRSEQLLDIADRQNMHSGACAARAVIELYRLVGRHKQLDREVLAFSVSHSYRSVRIYAYFALSTAAQTVYFRQPVREFKFTLPDERWTAYRFTKSLYGIWAPRHLERIKSGLEELPVTVSLDSLGSESVRLSSPCAHRSRTWINNHNSLLYCVR